MKEAMRMTQEIFKRYEKKYMLTQKQHDALIPVLERRMKADHYGEHTISNIYFDTRDYELVRKSIEKPEYEGKAAFEGIWEGDGQRRGICGIKEKV